MSIVIDLYLYLIITNHKTTTMNPIYLTAIITAPHS